MTRTTLALIFATAAAASVAVLPAQAAPGFGSGIAQPAENPLLQDVQQRVFIYHGRPYCFYFDGWHGAGWYRCGWNWRRGFGWGGIYGWNDWEYGPAFRRFGHRHHRYGGNWNGGNWGSRSYSGTSGNWSGKSYSGSGGNWRNHNSSVQMQAPSGSKTTTGFSSGAPQSGGKMSAPAAAPSSAPANVGGGGGKSGGGTAGSPQK